MNSTPDSFPWNTTRITLPLSFCCFLMTLPQLTIAADLPSLSAVRESSVRISQKLSLSKSRSEITRIDSEAKSKYAPRADGTWVFRAGDPVPALDTLTLTIQTKEGGSFLLLNFPTDSSLPATGPGLASNGNSVISQIEIEAGGKKLDASIYSSISQSNGGRVANTVFDAVRQQGDPGWESDASGWELGMSKPAQLVVKLAAPVAANSEVTVRLIAKTKFGNHIPGTVAAAIVGGATLSNDIKRLDDLRSSFFAWMESSNAELKGSLLVSDPTKAIPKSEALLLALTRAELIRTCGPEKVWEVATRKNGDAFLRALLTDRKWMESFLLGGTEGTTIADFAQSLENLRLLYSQLDSKVWDEPVLKKLATAMSLQAATMNRYRFVERFGLIEKAHRDGLLHGGFDQLDVRAMRHAINLSGTPNDFRHALNDIQFSSGGYVGACWAVNYVDPSVYGYSIQGWGFHDPLRHAYAVTKIFRDIGGVCGTLSGFGANAGLTHGVPSFTVGQPAHCAYVVRIGNQWATGNDVSGPHTNSWTAYEGASFSTTNGLLEPTENSPLYPEAMHKVWIAREQRASGLPAETWLKSYHEAITDQPTNYAVWLEVIKVLEAQSPATSPSDWIDLGTRAAKTFKAHQEAAWALAQRCFKNGQAKVPNPQDRVNLLLETHAVLSQKAVPTMYGYPQFATNLNWQADWIAEPNVAVDYFSKLLQLHHSEKTELNWVFSNVMSWGNARFAAKPESSGAHAKAIGDFFASQGDKADKTQMNTAIATGIRKASEAGDLTAYQTWSTLGEKQATPVAPADVYLNAEQRAARPKFEPFPGTLLSQTGMLQTSTQAPYDKPLSYSQVLGGGDLGFVDTANETKPWIKVALAGDGELSGIVLVDRYEFPSEQPWDVPLKVEVSTDDKTWTQVALIEKVEPVYRIDLRGKNLRARYIRIERQPGADPAKPNNGRLHMRNFLVFGRKLY